MLILKRRTGEAITVGGCVTIHLLKIGRGTVSIGIDAPEQVTVRRTELAEKAGGADHRERPSP